MILSPIRINLPPRSPFPHPHPHPHPHPTPLLHILLQCLLCRYQHHPRALNINALLLPQPPIVHPGPPLPTLTDNAPSPPILSPGFAAWEELHRHEIQVSGHHGHCYLLLVMDPLRLCYTMNHCYLPELLGNSPRQYCADVRIRRVIGGLSK